jgi:hypothetical protein
VDPDLPQVAPQAGVFAEAEFSRRDDEDPGQKDLVRSVVRDLDARDFELFSYSG